MRPVACKIAPVTRDLAGQSNSARARPAGRCQLETGGIDALAA
jgi:hypothetical protein